MLDVNPRIVIKRGDSAVPWGAISTACSSEEIVALPQPETVEVDVGTDQKLVASNLPVHSASHRQRRDSLRRTRYHRESRGEEDEFAV